MKVTRPVEKSIDLIFVIDKSGSMYGSEDDTIGGFNSFIDKQKAKEVNTKVTTVFFNNDYHVLYKRKPIDNVEKLTRENYSVGGSTALFDAIGKTVIDLEKEIKNNALFVIMTDGQENSSVEFSKSQIKKMIEDNKWKFIFIGADIDSYAEASHLGINREHTANFKKSKSGIENLYNSISIAADYTANDMEMDDGAWKKNLREYD